MSVSDFTLRGFMNQMGQIQRLGPLSKVIGMIPGMREVTERLGGDVAVENQIASMRAIYDSMSDQERCHPDGLSASRRRRVASGAGASIQEVSHFLAQFRTTQSMMWQVASRPPWGVAGLNRVLGLVTSNPRQRDPSWLQPVVPRKLWKPLLWMLLLVLGCVILAIFARYMM